MASVRSQISRGSDPTAVGRIAMLRIANMYGDNWHLTIAPSVQEFGRLIKDRMMTSTGKFRYETEDVLLGLVRLQKSVSDQLLLTQIITIMGMQVHKDKIYEFSMQGR